MAGLYLRTMVPALYGMSLTECLRRFLVTQGLIQPPNIAALVSTMLAPLFLYVLVWCLGWGVTGGGIAVGICYWINAGLQIVLYRRACRTFSVHARKSTGLGRDPRPVSGPGRWERDHHHEDIKNKSSPAAAAAPWNTVPNIQEEEEEEEGFKSADRDVNPGTTATTPIEGDPAVTWNGLSPRDAFRGWVMYFRIALPSMTMLCAEWWAFEIVIFLAGTLGDVTLSAVGIGFQIDAIAFQWPLGFSVTAASRIGFFLGAGRPRHARRAAWAAVGCAISVVGLLGVITYGTRYRLPWIFTSDPTVAAATTKVLRLVAVAILGDAWIAMMGGGLRGV